MSKPKPKNRVRDRLVQDNHSGPNVVVELNFGGLMTMIGFCVAALVLIVWLKQVAPSTKPADPT